MCLLLLKTLDLLGPGQLKRPISGIFQIIFIYIFIFFIYLILGAVVNVTSAGLFLATHNSYLTKKARLPPSYFDASGTSHAMFTR